MTSVSDKIVPYYQMIGVGLLEYELAHGLDPVVSLRIWGREDPHHHESCPFFKCFSQAVSFVPVEVLESYWEDLLDMKQNEKSLYIGRGGVLSLSVIVAFIGVLFGVALGLIAASKGVHIFGAFGLTTSLVLPFLVLWHFSPKHGLSRRVAFARILSHEILKRRGGGGRIHSLRGKNLITASRQLVGGGILHN